MINWFQENKLLLMTLCLAGLLSACGSEQELAEINGKKITIDQFEAYLELKRITPKNG